MRANEGVGGGREGEGRGFNDHVGEEIGFVFVGLKRLHCLRGGVCERVVSVSVCVCVCE